MLAKRLGLQLVSFLLLPVVVDGVNEFGNTVVQILQDVISFTCVTVCIPLSTFLNRLGCLLLSLSLDLTATSTLSLTPLVDLIICKKFLSILKSFDMSFLFL